MLPVVLFEDYLTQCQSKMGWFVFYGMDEVGVEGGRYCFNGKVG